MFDRPDQNDSPRRATARKEFAAWLFLLPSLSGVLIFSSLPVIASAVLSFFDWKLASSPRFVGLGNYERLLGFHAASPNASSLLLAGFFVVVAGSLVAAIIGLTLLFLQQRLRALVAFTVFVLLLVALFPLSRATWQSWEPNDQMFWNAFYNTTFMMAVIPFEIFGSLMLALLLNQKLRGLHFFRAIYLLPSITIGVGTYILWKSLYTNTGGFNHILHTLGLRAVPWLSSPAWVKPSLMLMGMWAAIGGSNMVLYLAALQNVPQELMEAAEIDGANVWQRFWAVTWPMVVPTTFFIVIVSLIAGFQSGFDAAYVMTGGGPGNASITLAYYIYNQGFVGNNIGYAAAIAWVIVTFAFGVTMINFRLCGKVAAYRLGAIAP